MSAMGGGGVGGGGEGLRILGWRWVVFLDAMGGWESREGWGINLSKDFF